MGLAIIIGVICAGVIGLILWARGAIAAAERRHAAQVRANADAEAARERKMRTAVHTIRAPNPNAFRKASAAVPRPSSYAASTPRTIDDYGVVGGHDFSSTDSYSSGGGDSGGGCD